jgi:uncharacterized protein (DUF2147 family)
MRFLLKTIIKPPQLIALLLISMLLGSGSAHAQASDSIVGVWKTYDDDTNQPAALVEIAEKNGVYIGVITKLLDPNAPVYCSKCTDSRKGKPVNGLEILTGLKKTGSSYSGGQILDPDDGEIYRAEIKLKDQGSKLELRAYIGIPLLGRTQSWTREQ